MSRRVLGMIALGLLVWGAYLALGDWLHYNATATWRPWRAAMILAAVGGLVGVALGFAIAILVSQVTPLPYSLRWWSIALGIGVSSLVGIVFGIYPAAKAARLDPIVALRHE